MTEQEQKYKYWLANFIDVSMLNDQQKYKIVLPEKDQILCEEVPEVIIEEDVKIYDIRKFFALKGNDYNHNLVDNFFLSDNIKVNKIYRSYYEQCRDVWLEKTREERINLAYSFVYTILSSTLFGTKEKQEENFLNDLTRGERAVYDYLQEFYFDKQGREINIVITQLLAEIGGISRPVVTNLLKKMSLYGIAEVEGHGARGTLIRLL